MQHEKVLASFEDRKESQAKGSLKTLEKARKQILPGSFRRNAALLILIFSPLRFSHTLDFQNYERKSQDCFKPLSVWQLVTVAIGC